MSTRRILLAYNSIINAIQTIPTNEIWYISTDGNVVTPYATDVFGANIVSNAYVDDKGVITFSSNVTTIGKQAFYRRTSLTSITLPEGVTTIGINALSRCYSLTSITLPEGLQTIEGSAFYDCRSLTSINIPDSVTSIGSSAFYGCRSLTSINIPDRVTMINTSTFCGCTSLTSVTIDNSVTEIGREAFADCTSLTSVYCKPTTPPASGLNVFDNNANGRKIYVPYQSLDAYKTAGYLSEYADDIVGYDFENDTVVGGVVA